MPARILLIEDEPALCLFIKVALRRAGFAMECEQRGDTGMRRALENLFDLIIVDGHLPGANGLDVVRTIKTQCPATRVMVMSAQGADFEAAAVRAGADHFQPKPCGMDLLVNAVEDLLGMKRAQVLAPAPTVL